MEKLARKLANEISKSLDYDDEKNQVIAYGLIAIIQMAVTVILVFILGLIVKAPVEALIICFSVSTLRKYSGGAHLNYIELCTSTGVIYCFIFSLISKYLLASILNTYFMSFIIAVVYILSFLAIYKLAPVDSPNKPIKTEKKKKRMKKDSFIVLSVYVSLSLIFLLLSRKNQIFNSFGISLLFGVTWQIITLTKFGSYLLNKINFAASKIIKFRKEANE